jgi:CMP-N,N'-diacetyllegionaminic acid synthase
MKKITDTLVIIPARGGSKGLPGKNIKLLNGKPLIYYTIEAAREVFPDENICVTTDDKKIIEIVEEIGLKVPFKRPAELATDNVGSWEVVKHAYDFYKAKGNTYEKLILLQPTSPFRRSTHINRAIDIFEKNDGAEMVVSVKQSKANPYFNLFEIGVNGFLKKSKDEVFKTRQETPTVVEYNGAIYILGNEALSKILLKERINIAPFFMEELESIDIDSIFDWKFAELVLSDVIKL